MSNRSKAGEHIIFRNELTSYSTSFLPASVIPSIGCNLRIKKSQ